MREMSIRVYMPWGSQNGHPGRLVKVLAEARPEGTLLSWEAESFTKLSPIAKDVNHCCFELLLLLLLR